MPLQIDVVDYHVAGESLRIITGLREIAGATMAEKACNALSDLRNERALATQEPRGHTDMFAAFLTAPVTQGAAFGALICDGVLDSSYKGTCGHGAIALAVAALEQGWVTAPAGMARITLDLPAGPVALDVDWDGERTGAVVYTHVPSKVDQAGLTLAGVTGDLVQAGPKVFLVDAKAAGISPDPVSAFAAYRRIQAAGDPPDLVQFRWGNLPAPRSFTLFGAVGFDRSPCGTASSALAAFAVASGQIAKGEWFTNTTLLGSSFQVRLSNDGLPQIRAQAYLAGKASLILQPDDPLRLGVAAPLLIGPEHRNP